MDDMTNSHERGDHLRRKPRRSIGGRLRCANCDVSAGIRHIRCTTRGEHYKWLAVDEPEYQQRRGAPCWWVLPQDPEFTTVNGETYCVWCAPHIVDRANLPANVVDFTSRTTVIQARRARDQKERTGEGTHRSAPGGKYTPTPAASPATPPAEATPPAPAKRKRTAKTSKPAASSKATAPASTKPRAAKPAAATPARDLPPEERQLTLF